MHIRNLKLKSGSITIDGRTFTGSSFSIDDDGKVTVDGVVQDGNLVGPVSIVVNGDVDSIDGPFAHVSVTGACRSVKTVNGSVKCGNVAGDITTVNGDVTCGNVSGYIRTTNGDIRHQGARS